MNIDLLAPPDEQSLLPEGITEAADGSYEARCCRCHEWRPLYFEISEVPVTGYEHYCGCTSWCRP